MKPGNTRADRAPSFQKTVLQGALLIGFLLLIFSNIAAAQTPRWVASSNPMPADVVRGQAPEGTSFVCRGRLNGETVPGTVVDGTCRIPYLGREYVLSEYQVLAGEVAWGGPGAAGILAGEVRGRPVQVCRAAYRQRTYFGKLDGNECTIAHEGRELLLTSFDVLQPVAITASAHAATTPPAVFGAPAPVADREWTWCAAENGDCRFDGVRDVRYGDGHRFVVRRFEAGVRCDDATFGDPAPASRKHCEFGPPAFAARGVVVPAPAARVLDPRVAEQRFATDLHSNLGLVLTMLSRERDLVYLQRADQRRMLQIDQHHRLRAPRETSACALDGTRTDCQWVLVPSPERDGSYFIRNAGFPVFLRVAGAVTAGAAVTTGACARGAEANCLWTLEPSLTQPDAVYLRSRAAPLYLQLDPRGDETVAQLSACPRAADDRNCQFELGVAAESQRIAGYRPGPVRLVSGTRDLLEFAVERRAVPLAAVANTSGEFTDLRR